MSDKMTPYEAVECRLNGEGWASVEEVIAALSSEPNGPINEPDHEGAAEGDE